MKKSIKVPAEQTMREAFHAILAGHMGLEVFGALLGHCDPDVEVLDPHNPVTTAYNCGRRCVGMEFRRMIDDVMPGGYAKCREAHHEWLQRVKDERELGEKKKEEEDEGDE